MQQLLDVNYRITWQGEWHVGSGFRTAAVDRVIQRIGGRPFVPGAQIKGVLRHTCERLALGLGLDAVDPHATSREQQRRVIEHFGPLRHSPLIVDRLFGSRFQGDCLFVDNALPLLPGQHGNRSALTGQSAQSTSSDHSYSSVVRTRTAIDRLTRTVREQHLFSTEMACPIELTGRIRARHREGVLTQHDGEFPYEYSLLVVALLSIDRLGGDKSIGLGRCQFHVDRVIWNDRPITIEQCLAPLAAIAEWDLSDIKQWLSDVRSESRV